MWEKIAKEMALPWRAAEAMHWQIGEIEMASRANVPVFHLAGQAQAAPPSHQPHPHYYSTPTTVSTTNGSTAGTRSNSRSPPTGMNASNPGPLTYPSTHNHTLPHMSQPSSPGSQGRAQKDSPGSVAGAECRNRADSARDTQRSTLDPGRHRAPKRYVSPFADKSFESENSS